MVGAGGFDQRVNVGADRIREGLWQRPQVVDAIEEGRNGFLGFMDELLHSAIADHEVGGAGVFVEQQNA